MQDPVDDVPSSNEASSMHCCSRSTAISLLKRLVLGQCVAFAVSATGVFSTLLVNQNRSFPLLQSATAYLWITAICFPAYMIALHRAKSRGPNFGQFSNFVPMSRIWRFGLVAVVDLEANYAVVKAYQYTDMTSVQLLDCFTIPFVMVLSYFFLSMRFTRGQLAGAFVAVCGLALLVVFDVDGLSRSDAGTKPLLGDMLCLVSSACYAISNVACERLIKVDETKKVDEYFPLASGDAPQSHRRDILTVTTISDSDSSASHLSTVVSPLHPSSPGDVREKPAAPPALLPRVPAWLPIMEYLAFMPCAGFVFAVIQMLLIERDALNLSFNEGWSEACIAYQCLFGLSMVIVYSGMPVLFLSSSAAFANISLLTADVYSIIWNVTVFSIDPRWEFFVAYLLIVAGIVVYDLKGRAAT